MPLGQIHKKQEQRFGGISTEKQQDQRWLRQDQKVRNEYEEMQKQAGPLSLTQQLQGVEELTQTERELYGRRYTQADVSINLSGLAEETTERIDMRTVPHPREEELPRLSKLKAKQLRSKINDEEEAAYKAKQKEAEGRFITVEDVQSKWVKENVLAKSTKLQDAEGNEESITQQDLLKRVLAGDYSNLQQLDPMLRSLAAGKYFAKLNIKNLKTFNAEGIVNALFKNGGVSQLMNPLFRVGVSILLRGGELEGNAMFASNPQLWQEVEDLCNQRIMSATIYSSPKQDDGIPAEDLERNRRSQVFIAKTLLVAHLGKLQREDTDPQTKLKRKTNWSGGVATAFAHCSRVAITLPGYKKEMERFIGGKNGQESGFYKRSAATHKLAKKKRSGTSELIEKKSLGTFYGQRGMNVAIGGLGNDGVQGRGQQMRKIKNDGSCGHVYMHMEEGNSHKYTGLLIGFESDSPGVMNMTGHVHGLGNPEFVSSFGGMRTDEIGDKYGGRTVDLSGMKAEVFDDVIQRFEARMNTLMNHVDQGGPGAEAAQAEIMNISDMLCGKLMTKEQIAYVVGGGVRQ